MKIAIFEYYHFQYALTMAELFKGHKLVFYVSQRIHDSLKKYNDNLPEGEYIINEESEIGNNAANYIEEINNADFDMVLINPFFNYYNEFNKLVLALRPKILLTIHNLNTWFKPGFHGPKSYKEMKAKRKMANRADFIAVEDFLFNYLNTEKPAYLNQEKVVYIPFTLYSLGLRNRIERKENKKFKVVLPGAVDKTRRSYEDVIEVINKFAEENKNICFAFAGPALGEYGAKVVKELKMANKKSSGIARFFEERPKPEEFQYEMASADIVLSTSNKIFDGFGIKEYIGKTKPTAAIHDMMSFELPGLLPAHLGIPKNLKTSVISYSNADELYMVLSDLYDNEEKLSALKKEAIANSAKFSAEEIRRGLPFLN